MTDIQGNIFASKYIKETVEQIEDHLHKPAKCYPDQADPILLTATASAWGNFTNITELWSAAGAPTEPFDIHWGVVSTISANGNYQIKLFKGESGLEEVMAHIPFSRNAVQSQEGALPIQTPVVVPGTRISAAISSSNAVADTCNISIIYHEY